MFYEQKRVCNSLVTVILKAKLLSKIRMKLIMLNLQTPSGPPGVVLRAAGLAIP
jgi:hypothetical protein